MLLRDRISAGSTTSRKPRLQMFEFQRPKPRSRKSSKAEIKVEGQPASPAAAAAGESGTVSASTLPLQAACNPRPTSTSSPPRLSHIAAIHLPVADLQVSREFYGGVLGLKIVSAREDGEDGETGEVRLKVWQGREMEMVLYQSGCSGSKGKERLLELQDMRPQYSLAVSMKEDMRLWEGWLREKGIDGVESTTGAAGRVLFRDPDGNVGAIIWKRGNEDDENC